MNLLQFFKLPCVGLQCVIVEYPDNTHLRLRYSGTFRYTEVDMTNFRKKTNKGGYGWGIMVVNNDPFLNK